MQDMVRLISEAEQAKKAGDEGYVKLMQYSDTSREKRSPVKVANNNPVLAVASELTSCQVPINQTVENLTPKSLGMHYAHCSGSQLSLHRSA